MIAKYFYVSAINGPRKHLVAGPYKKHQDALDRVEDVRRYADSQDPFSHFMAWGTAGSDAPRTTPLGPNWSPAPA